MNLLRIGIALATVVGIIQAQAQPAKPLAFEVASIKQSVPMEEALPLIRQGKLKQGRTIDQFRAEYNFTSLLSLIMQAYKVDRDQIAGPDWMLTTNFDIEAKLPQGATVDQVPEMLQTLLAERFGLKMHKEMRDLQVYALIVGKNGPKMKDTTNEPDPKTPEGAVAVDSPWGTRMYVVRDKAVTTGTGPGVGTMTSAMSNGHLHEELSKGTMQVLAEVLKGLAAQRRVIDKTGLKGTYAIVLDYDLPTGHPPAPEGSAPDPGGDPVIESLKTPVEKLGLKLESRKQPIETIVIDHVEAKPTGN
jgi:uncharacterized protein (TIGR03435 family)